MLDLLARVFDFCQAERGGGAFEEMAEGGEGFEVFFFAGGGDGMLDFGVVWKGGMRGEEKEYLQRIIHFGECLFGLLEKSKDYGFAKLALILVVVHL